IATDGKIVSSIDRESDETDKITAVRDIQDNCVLLALSGLGLQDKVLQLQMESKRIGLEMNLSKTKWMRNTVCGESRINIEGQIIEEVGSYVYLGQQLSFTDIIVGECR
ncbi:hypothetical protein Tcan_00702, partial [Toxocara canis]